MENNSFELARLGKVMKKELVENGRSLLLKAALVFGVAIVSALITSWGNTGSYTQDWMFNDGYYRNIDPAWPDLTVFYLLLFMIFGTISASMTGFGLCSKESRLREITLPSTQAEKFLARWLLFVPVATVLILIALVVAEVVRVGVFSLSLDDPRRVMFMRPSYFLYTTDGAWNHAVYLFSTTFMMFQSLACLGGILWHRAAYVKTALACGVIWIAYLMVGALTIQAFDGQVSIVNAFGTVNFNRLLCLSMLAVCIFCHLTAYFRYKEMEIHEHW